MNIKTLHVRTAQRILICRALCELSSSVIRLPQMRTVLVCSQIRLFGGIASVRTKTALGSEAS